MELGLDFDDCDFTEKVRQTVTGTSYNAKVCKPEWFFSDRADNGRNDMATVYKFRGDFHFQRENYKLAIDCYKNSLERLGEHNRTMRRELMESLARSYMKNEMFDAAQKYVDNVFNDCITPENYCHALMLQQQLYNRSNDIPNELSVLQKLITLHPVNAQIWLKLIYLFERVRHPLSLQQNESEDENVIKTFESISKNIANEEITEKDTELSFEESTVNDKRREKKCECTNCDSLIQSEKGNTKENLSISSLSLKEPKYLREPKDDTGQNAVKRLKEEEENVIQQIDMKSLESTLREYPTDFILLTCYIRTRLILSSVQGTIGSFIKDKNLQLVAEINSKIEDLIVEESVLEVVTQYLKRDMFEAEVDSVDDKTDSNQDVMAVLDNVITSDKFNKRWFSWMKEIPQH